MANLSGGMYYTCIYCYIDTRAGYSARLDLYHDRSSITPVIHLSYRLRSRVS